MSLFSKPKIAVWPKANNLEIYLDKKDNNNFKFEINLWEEKSVSDLQSLAIFLKQNKITSCSVLVPDDIVLTKSFIYDSKIDSIDKKEVIGLAESFVNFKINPDSIEYNLVQGTDKTIIQSIIFDKAKITTLQKNLTLLGLTVEHYRPVSAAISNIIKNYYSKEYFLIYPISSHEYLLSLSKADSVYLTSIIKGPSLEIQKIINYSNLYFSDVTKKIFVPNGKDLDIVSTTQLDKTNYSDTQIATECHRSTNLPLPILGCFVDVISSKTKSLSVSTPTKNVPVEPIAQVEPINTNMENKKNLLPIVAVFLFTAALASVIIWYVLNNNKTVIEVPVEDTPIVQVDPTPTAIPTPIIEEIEKNIKIQVLNATEINGQAATVKDFLVKLDFTAVSVGNGKEKVTQNIVRIKPGTSADAIKAYFESKLMDSFPATYDLETLTSTSTYDAIFVIGTDLSSSSVSTSSSAKATITPTKAATNSTKVTLTPVED